MAITAQLFDGTTLEFPDDTPRSVIDKTVERATEERQVKSDTGFTGAFSAGKERLKGDIAALAGRVGIMDTEQAEQYKAHKENLAEKMFKPTQEGWSEAPWMKFKETLGGSLPYTAAPLAAGIAAATLPVSAPVAAGIGAAGAGIASLGQFTGSNLSRQMQENPNMKLAETNLGAAAAAALPQAALDVVSLRMIPGIGKIFGAAGKEITPAIAKQIAEQGIAKTALAYGASGAKLSGIEGATEAGQQFFERLQAGLNLTDEQARSEYFDNFIGGAVLGGALSVPGTAIERRQTVAKGAQMEEEAKRQEIIDRQKAQREAYLAQQQQIQQTSQNLGVPQTLALPAPEEKLEAMPEAVDPLINPLGRFKSTDLSPKEVAEVNKRRKEMGKPRIGHTFSIEDLADVFKPEESTAAEGVLGRLIAARTNFAGEDIPAQSIALAAQQRGLDTRTQGFKDFLTRVTGSDNLESMSAPQRFAVAQSIKNLKAGEETRILEAGISNAKHYTPEQYNDTLRGLSKEFKQMGNQENGKNSVLKLIGKYSGLTSPKDQERILFEAVKSGDLERNVKESSTGNTIETFKPAEAMTPLPGGMDIRKETFKQGEHPESYDVRAGSRVISSVETAEEADKNAAIYEQHRQAQIINLEKQIRKLESEMAKRDAELVNDQAIGNDQGNEFFIKSANYYGQNQVANTAIADLRQKQQTFAEPVRVEPVGTKPIAKESYTFYEKDQPQVKFDTEEQAEQYGISRLDDATLEQIIKSAPAQKQTGRVKRYADLAQKELNDRNSIESERGIAVTTKQGLQGGKERLEKLGIYSKEVHDSLEALRQTLLPALKRYGLERVALRILNSIEDGKADGYYVQQVMAIALDAKNPMGTLRHESIHALKELGAFTSQEWKVLENKAKSEWVQKYIKDANLYESYKEQYKAEHGNLLGFEPYIQEEAIAEAFKHFKLGNLQPGMVGNIWVRLNKMFEALRNAFNKLGFQTAEDIFTNVEEGKKPPTKEATLAEPKYSLKSPLEEAFNYARTKNFKTNRDLKVDLQQSALDKLKEAKIDINNFDEKTIKYLADLGVQDAMYALKTNENAIGWYDVTVAKALNVISLLHPEIKTDPDAKFAFTWALAVTSNGIKVDKNFQLAEQAYNYYKKNGVMPTNLQAGQAQGPINDGLKTFNEMVAKYGTDNTRKFMATEFTPKEIKELTGIEINGELASTKLLGASIIGPKIGNGFYSNLNGEFDRLTMDRWLMRTWGRWTGTLIEQNLPQIQKTRESVNDMFKRFGNDPETKKNIEQVLKRKITKADLATVTSRDNLAKDIAKQSVKPENRTVYNRTELGSDLRKATNNLSKYLDGQKEAPKTGTERNQIRTVFNEMLEDLRQRGYDDLTMSDLQALMWYPERRLYDTAKESEATEGYKDDEAPDYANAAAKLVEENGIPKDDITKAVKETEKKYADRARGIQPNEGGNAPEISTEGKTRGFTENERAKFAEEFSTAKTKKYALKSQIDPAIQSRIGATTTKRKEAGFVERMMDAISPTAVTKLRQAFINKYESIEQLSHLRGEKFGGDQLLAENSAIAAALQSDRAAGVAASSFRDGVPVLDKGYTYVTNMDNKVKGLIPILEPLMKYKDPYIFQTFQYYAGTRRGRRLDAEGREKTFTKEDIEAGKQLEAQFPEFATVFDEYQKYNQGLVKYMMDTGVISAQEAKSWTENWDYIPFYRQLDGEKTAGPKVFSPIAGVAKPKKLKGSEAPLDDFMETIVRNARAAIEAGMKNEAARRVIRDVVDFGLGERLPSSQSGSDVVSVKENGMTVYYRVADPLLVESLKGLNLPQLPFMDFLSAPANLLRNFVTKDPGFIIANLGRDSMQAWITSGTDMKPLVDTFKQFGRELLNQSPEAYALAKSGLTGYDFAGDVKSTAQQVEKELRKRSGTRTKREQALLPITAFWDMLETGSHASDMATRAEVYKRTLERTGSEAEAFYQAMEVMNFSRKGNSAIVRILSAMIPFFNARVQGLDVLYRTGFGKAAMENKEKIQKAFIFRSMVLLGTSVMYWAIVSDDDEYKKLSKEEKDNYWIIPAIEIGGKPFRFPIPFELGVLFKVLPERALEYSFGTDTGKDLRDSLTRNAMSTLSFNPIPQAVLPFVENVTNHSFFTGEPIIGKGQEKLAPQYQYTGSTSDLAKKIGKELDYAPAKVENLIRGYTGTMGTYAMMLIDSVINGEGDTVKATKRMEQLPVIKRFFAGDSGTISAYYDLKSEVETVVDTVNMLQRTGNSEDLKTYLQENKKLYGLKNYIGVLDKSMKKLSEASKMINESKTMTADEKREAIDRIHDGQLKLTERVRILRKQQE
jgi:hypothetical protein